MSHNIPDPVRFLMLAAALLSAEAFTVSPMRPPSVTTHRCAAHTIQAMADDAEIAKAAAAVKKVILQSHILNGSRTPVLPSSPSCRPHHVISRHHLRLQQSSARLSRLLR